MFVRKNGNASKQKSSKFDGHCSHQLIARTVNLHVIVEKCGKIYEINDGI